MFQRCAKAFECLYLLISYWSIPFQRDHVSPVQFAGSTQPPELRCPGYQLHVRGFTCLPSQPSPMHDHHFLSTPHQHLATQVPIPGPFSLASDLDTPKRDPKARLVLRRPRALALAVGPGPGAEGAAARFDERPAVAALPDALGAGADADEPNLAAVVAEAEVDVPIGGREGGGKEEAEEEGKRGFDDGCHV